MDQPTMPKKKTAGYFAENVRNHRMRKGLSFRQAQLDSGVDKANIARAESGTEPSLATFCGLVMWTGMSAKTAVEQFAKR